MRERKPLMIVVSAPSGGGKTTIVESLLRKVSDITRSVSVTTRAPRPGEKDKEDYIFVSGEEFKKRIEEGDFLEWEENFENYYGTSETQIKEALSCGKDVVLCIDVKGARTVKEKFPESLSVFIMPPSIEELKDRLEKRDADHPEQVALRLEEAKKEIEAADEYDYMVVNEELEKAEKELVAIVESARRNSITSEQKNEA